MASIKKLLDIDIQFPSIDIRVELIVLRAYLSQMEHGIKSVSNNYIQSEMNNFKDSEYIEYQHIYQIAEEEMPRIIRMPFIVTICALFDNSISRLLDYAKSKENQGLSLKDINSRSTIETYNKYMQHVLKYEYQFDNSTIKRINQINIVRNYSAHCNGNLDLLSKEKINELQKISNYTEGLEINDNTIDISYDYLNEALQTVESALNELIDYMITKYKKP
jgi:hypothetical protein